MFTPKNFDKAQVGNYMKLEEGQNRIRVLKEPVTGYVYWEDKNGNLVPKNKMAGEGGKPVRVKDYDDLDMEVRAAMRGFAAMVVWNYAVNKVQILEIKQVGIMMALEALANSKSWGDITKFDVVITKTKTGSQPTDVEYAVMPEPKEELPEEIQTASAKSKINLEALYEGKDPFDTSVQMEDIDLDAALNDSKN